MPGIKAIFDDPKTSTRNAALLAKRAGVTPKAAADFLRDQAASQITKRATKPDESAYAPTGGPRGEWLGDVIYLRDYEGVNKQRGCILTLLEVNSRFVYARALTAATSAKTAEALVDILEQNTGDVADSNVAPIVRLRTDGGPEFAGKFSALLKTLGIPHEKGQPGTHARLGRLDRYHGLLRRQIGEVFAQRNSHVWVDVLQDLVDNHNTSPSRALNAIGRGTAPADVGAADTEILRHADLARAAQLRHDVDTMRVEPGTKVRLLTSALKKAPRFVKGQEATWTPELYEVVERAGTNTFRIAVGPGENPIWPMHSIQVVRKALGQANEAGPKVIKSVVRAQRTEARNISPEEQAAALAAPARARSARAPRVDYARLASGRA